MILMRGAALLALLLFAASPPAVQAQTVSDPAAQAVFDQIAQDLVTQMEGASTLDALKTRVLGGGSIAVWPLAPDDAPLPRPVLEAWNDTLTDSLLRAVKGRHKIIARADLTAMIKEAQHAEVVAETGNPVAAVIKSGAKADYVLSGRARVSDNGVAVSYRLVEMKTNAAKASSKVYVVPVDFATLAGQQDSLAMDAATLDAGKYFAGNIPDLKVLRIRGVRHAESGVETPLGRYLASRMVDAIQERASSAITEHKVRVVEASLDDTAIKAVKTRSLSDKGLSGELTGGEPGSYVFEGTYWAVGSFVELRLAAADAQGHRYAWTKRILKASLRPELTGSDSPTWTKPPGDEWAKNPGTGPISLDLNSNKGKNPSYRVGESMVLLLKLADDGYVDCYYRQVDGQTIKIFPNRYSPGNHISARRVASIPGEGMPFTFQVQEPQGVERVKCFAAERGVSSQLPREIAAMDMQPLPAHLADKLSDAYRAVPGIRFSESTMVVTVHR